MPPPVPFFYGNSIRAADKEWLISFRPVEGNELWSPPATFELFLPAATIIRVTVEQIEHPGWASLRFHGDFSQVSRPEDVVLSPISEDDANELAAILTKRLGLPRQPRSVLPFALAAGSVNPLDDNAYIAVVGTQMPPGHFEGPDFEDVRLTGDHHRIAGRIPGQRYLVTGFYQRARSKDSLGVGYRGPRIRVMTISPEPAAPLRAEVQWWTPPLSPSLRDSVLALLHPTAEDGHEQLEFSTRLDPQTVVVGALDCSGAQRTGADAARLAQLALATALTEPAYDPLLGPPILPPASVFDDHAAWAAWLIGRQPLPSEPGPLLTTLGNQIGAVLEGANLRGHCLYAGGILALVRAGRATLLRRGMARAYLLREGTLQPLQYEHILGREPEYAARMQQSPELDRHRWVPVSAFTQVDLPGATPPLEIEVQRGDRLIFALGLELLTALEDPAREALLTAAIPDVVAGMPPTPDMALRGWGIVAVDINGA